ncbi:hypothetical protein T459_04641 [Capsicum annuum]|uniref:Uncharacterized protein n=1 Tax=Capsicum annuum TaxID=4072 RepID=A0A2G3A5P0_CAPAN|nr:hypothetical protein T459_04641 [Capsicum annuum]
MPPIGGVDLPLTELMKLKRPTKSLITGLRKDEDPQLFLERIQKTAQTMVDSDEAAMKLAARNLDLINLLKGNGNNIFNYGLYQDDFFFLKSALPSTMYMPLGSQVLVHPPAGLPQCFLHPQKIASTPEIFESKDMNIDQTLMSSYSEKPSSSNGYKLFLPFPNNEEKKTNKSMEL